QEIGTGAAVLHGNVGEQQSRLAGLAPHLAADLALLFPALVMRRDLGLDEGDDGLAEELVLLAVDLARYGHGAPSQAWRRWCQTLRVRHHSSNLGRRNGAPVIPEAEPQARLSGIS